MKDGLSTHQAQVLNRLIMSQNKSKVVPTEYTTKWAEKYHSYSYWATKWPRGVQTLETMIKRQLIVRVITGEKVEIAITPRGREVFRISMEYAHRFRRY